MKNEYDLSKCSVTVKDGKLVVDEKWDEMCPHKDGDFMTTGSGTIVICKGDADFYACLSISGLFIDGRINMSGVPRKSTHEEIQKLQDALAAKGKMWSDEEKRIVRWRARKGESGNYKYVVLGCDGANVIDTCDSWGRTDNSRFESGNYFHLSDGRARELADDINALLAQYRGV